MICRYDEVYKLFYISGADYLGKQISQKHLSGFFSSKAIEALMQNVAIICWLVIVAFFSVLTPCFARQKQDVLEQLTMKIEQEQDSGQKSRLYIYRARNLLQTGRIKEVLSDLDKAAELDPAHGIVFLERSKVYLSIKEYKKARLDALTAKEKNPALSREIDQLIDVIDQEISKLDENQPDLSISYLDGVTVKEKSRLDVVREFDQCEAGHWVKQVSESGSFIILEDGSKWSVNTQQQPEAASWESGDFVTVCSQINVLINTSDPKMPRRVNSFRQE